MQTKQEECVICCETLNDDICNIKCGHHFHNKCLKRMNNDLCPLCRTKMGINIIDENDENDENQRLTDEQIQTMFALGQQRLQRIIDERIEEEERNRIMNEELIRRMNEVNKLNKPIVVLALVVV